MENQSNVELRSLDGKTSHAKLNVRTLPQNERMMNAVKRLAIFWGIMLCFVPLPAVHFVAVPLFFLLGPIMAFRAYSVSKKFTAGEAPCPICTKPVSFEGQRFLASFKDRCSHCLNDLYVSASE